MSWKACIRCGDATMIEIEGEAVCPGCMLLELSTPPVEGRVLTGGIKQTTGGGYQIHPQTI